MIATRNQPESGPCDFNHHPPVSGRVVVVAALVWLSNWLLIGPQVASGDTVWLRDLKAAPLHGRIVAVDETAVRLVVARDEGPETLAIPRTEVRAWHEVIDEASLEALGSDQREDYLAMAIELSAFRFDPSARQLAVELALIALSLSAEAGDETTGRRAWLLLYAELEQPEQRARCLAAGKELGFVAREYRDVAFNEGAASRATPVSDAQLRQLLALVRGMRRGEPDQASPRIAEKELETLLGPWRHLVTAAELVAWRGEARLSDAALLRLLDLETVLEQGGPPAIEDPDDWSVLARLEPVPIPSPREVVMNITGFDPGPTRWQNGKWSQ